MADEFFFYDPNASTRMEIKQSPFMLTINAPDGSRLVSVNYDGTLTYGAGYAPDAAARIFWESVSAAEPTKRIAELEAAGNAIVEKRQNDLVRKRADALVAKDMRIAILKEEVFNGDAERHQLAARIAELQSVIALFIAYDETDDEDGAAMMVKYDEAVRAARAVLEKKNG